MKKNNKKGFTLIELLAVLVVLAILALIAIPIVIKVINNAREDSYKRSIEGYARAVEMGVARWAMANPGVEFPRKLSLLIDENKNSYIDYKGDEVECEDDITYDNTTNQVQLKNCHLVKTESDGSKKPKSDDYDYDGVEVKPSTSATPAYEEYKVGDSIKFSNEDYHVIAESGINQKYVVALKDEPLRSKVTQANGSTSDYITSRGYGGVMYNNTTYSTNYEESEIKKIIDSWTNQYGDKLLNVGGYVARLITIDELLIDDFYYELFDNGSLYERRPIEQTPTWLYDSDYSYYTMSSYNDSYDSLWCVGSNGILHQCSVGYSSVGVARPVINVLKSAITKN